MKNRLDPEDAPVHEWYRFVLSYPPHLVRDYLDRFGMTSGHRVLDPFCGTGTTLVESKKRGIPSVGVEATPMAHLASKTKVNWSLNPDGLLEHAREVADRTVERLETEGTPDEPLQLFERSGREKLRELPPETTRLLLKNSISPLPLHKTLALLECLEGCRDDRYYDHERVALAMALTGPIGNLHFGPEVGVGKPKPDAAVVANWLVRIEGMARDLRIVQDLKETPSIVHHADARDILAVLEPESIDAIITSPPYPNEKDYSRTTRLETVLLGFMTDREDLQRIKKGLVRSNTRGVYKVDADDELVANHAEISRIAEEIEA
ncbi:MAG: DNA methyltransferase, partial [Candidatus Binatia bacterium]